MGFPRQKYWSGWPFPTLRDLSDPGIKTVSLALAGRFFTISATWEARFSGSSAGKESACNAEDRGWIPGLGRSSGEGMGYPLHYSWASLVAQLVKNPPASGRPGFIPWVGKIPWRRERLPTPVFSPGEFHGLHSPWGHKELDTTDRLSRSFIILCPLNVYNIISQ